MVTSQVEEQLEPADPSGAPQQETLQARGVVVLILFVLAVAGLFYRVYPAHHRLALHPSFIDEVFSNNLVLFAARLTLLSAAGVLAVAAVFIVVSFWKRAQAGHWMSRFGPFETQAVEDLAGQVDQWIAWWREENERADELQERVEESEKVLVELYEAFQAVQAELEGLRSGEGENDDPEEHS